MRSAGAHIRPTTPLNEPGGGTKRFNSRTIQYTIPPIRSDDQL